MVSAAEHINVISGLDTPAMLIRQWCEAWEAGKDAPDADMTALLGITAVPYEDGWLIDRGALYVLPDGRACGVKQDSRSAAFCRAPAAYQGGACGDDLAKGCTCRWRKVHRLNIRNYYSDTLQNKPCAFVPKFQRLRTTLCGQSQANQPFLSDTALPFCRFLHYHFQLRPFC